MAGQYRRDIDGLRSIAIIPVLLFHAGLSQMGGGFVGVDVFFVISGFLITGIIDREIREKRFSIVNFYERRIRRIFPALAVVLLFVIAGAWWLFLPSDFPSVPRSIIAALLFVANIFFWMSTGYFDSAAQLKPLLHTWSLAVEEQFYLFFPVLLMLIAKASARTRSLVIWGMALVSLALCVVLTAAKQEFAFYMIVTRAWELMAGSLLAMGAVPAVRSPMARQAIAFAGLAAILWAVFTFREDIGFPGAYALFPVLGAAALIHSAPGTLVGRLLSTRLAVGIGLISYSLYLWHWPIIVFTSYATEAPLTGWTTVAVVAASLVAAILSWRFVERPFRSKESFDRKAIFSLAGLASVAIVALCGVGLIGHGWPSRFPAQVAALDNASKDFSPARKACHRGDDEGPSNRKPACTLGAKVAPSTLVWGDSHGVELSYALSRIAEAKGQSLVQETASACTPFIGNRSRINARCTAHNRAVMDYVAAHPAIRTVVMAGFWSSPDNRSRPGLPGAVEETALRLLAMGRHVVIVGGEPAQSFAVPRHLALAAAHGRLAQVRGVRRSVVEQRMAYLAPTLTKLSAKGVAIVDPAAILCPSPAGQDADCDVIRDGKPLYFDSHHLSNHGAAIVAAQVAPHIWPR